MSLSTVYGKRGRVMADKRMIAVFHYDNGRYGSEPYKYEEIKRGEWEDMGDFEQCSVCKGTHLKEFQSYYGKTTWIKTPYCPNCGADMREREGE